MRKEAIRVPLARPAGAATALVAGLALAIGAAAALAQPQGGGPDAAPAAGSPTARQQGTAPRDTNGPGPAGRGPGGFGAGAQLDLPSEPTAVALPELSAEVTDPGPMFDSAPSQAPGLGPEDFDYDTREYFVSGTADGRPYTTRVVVRAPSDDSDFSGLVPGAVPCREAARAVRQQEPVRRARRSAPRSARGRGLVAAGVSRPDPGGRGGRRVLS
ncbi:MAG: hypothetical protein JXB36_17620 [Gammaproteobacteria bacterium]|nr:hypothetical protein [Gammaproteobacteria bacterium]